MRMRDWVIWGTPFLADGSVGTFLPGILFYRIKLNKLTSPRRRGSWNLPPWNTPQFRESNQCLSCKMGQLFSFIIYVIIQQLAQRLLKTGAIVSKIVHQFQNKQEDISEQTDERQNIHHLYRVDRQCQLVALGKDLWR